MADTRRLTVHVASQPAAFTWLAALCLAAVPLVLALGTAALVTRWSAGALVAEAGLCGLLAWSFRERPSLARRIVHMTALTSLGLGAGLVGWFFGPHSGFEGLITLFVVLIGVLSGGLSIPMPALAGWLAYLGCAAGQAIVTGLVIAGQIPDQSLIPVMLAGFTRTQIVVAQISLQLVFLLAFLLGRAFQRRYEELARQVDEALRAAARREATLEEARAEYKRALEAARRYQPPREGWRTPAPWHPGQLVDTETDARARRAARAAAPAGPSDDLASAMREGPLSPDQVRVMVIDVAAALAALHARGSAHLEVNPEHIERKDGAWTLVDPGILQLRAAAAGAPPVSGQRYLAPERLGGAFVDARADVYGLAATAYAALTGREPYAGLGAEAVPRAVMSDPPFDARRLAGLPDPLARALRTGLAREPEARYTDVAALRDALCFGLEAASAQAIATADRQTSSVVETGRFAAAEGAAGGGGGAGGAIARAAPDVETLSGAERRSGSAPAAKRRRSASSTMRVATPPPSTPSAVWQGAYRSKMRGFTIGITALCAGGALMFAYIVKHAEARWVAWICMAGVVAAAWLHRVLTEARGHTVLYWPWALIGLFSVGPAYALGLHSAFAVVVVVWLFAGGLFRTEQAALWTDRRGLVLACCITAHTVALFLVLGGVIGDYGNAPLRRDDLPMWEVLAMHVLLMLIYVAAFAAGLVVDRRYQALSMRAQTAIREAAHQEAMLARTREQLDDLLANESSGIFTGLRLGRYQLGRLLGRGGMGEVYEATSAASGRRVALKLVRGDKLSEPQHLRLFLGEAEALGRVQSLYVARVLDVGGPEDEVPYIAMEYIEGRALAELLRERERLAAPETLAMIRDIGRGLADVHDAGVVHCDIKPHNVILTEPTGDGGHGAVARWKLVDFGVAKRVDVVGAPGAEGSVRAVMGTPMYMAPEQALGDRVDARADLYSLCALVYRALTGRPPFIGDHPRDIAEAVMASGPPDPRRLAECSDDVMLALRVGLAARPADRFASARELTDAMEAAFAGRLDAATRRRANELLRRAPWG